MRQLLYVSSTPRNITPATLDRILAASRANNALLGITGLLIYIDGGFLQILEGEERVVRELYMRISTDRGLPPLKWSSLKYGFDQGGLDRWQGRGTQQKRLSRSYGRSMC